MPPPASQHNMMETSLERDALQQDEGGDIAAAVPPPPRQSAVASQLQLAQPRDDDNSLLSSQPSQSSDEHMQTGAAAEPFVDDGFFMTQAPSISEYASQMASSQAANEGSMESEHDIVLDLDETDKFGEEAMADVVRSAAVVSRTVDDTYPSSMPPLSPGPPSPVKVEQREEKEEGGDRRQTEEPAVVAVAEVTVEREAVGAAAADEAEHFSAEMIAHRQRVRNAELVQQRRENDELAAPSVRQMQHDTLPEESKQGEEDEEEHAAPRGTSAKRGRVSASSGAGGSDRADKRRRSVRFDDQRNTEHVARDDVSDGPSVGSDGGLSLAELLRAVSVEAVASQPIAVFDGWKGDDFAWHCSYWKAVQL